MIPAYAGHPSAAPRFSPPYVPQVVPQPVQGRPPQVKQCPNGEPRPGGKGVVVVFFFC
jgi:hypothetical protein